MFVWLKYLEGKIEEVFDYLFFSIDKCEELWGFLEVND